MNCAKSKTCRHCGLVGELSQFYVKRKVASRRTSMGTCISCAKIKIKEANDKRKQQRVEWGRKNAKRRYEIESSRPDYKEKRKRNYEKNKAAYITRAYNRYLKRKGQTLKTIRYKELQAVYKKAKELTEITGKSYNVDHIIPLSHPQICGLNVPWNMQVLPEKENKQKSNRWDGTYENIGWIDV